MCGVSSSVCLSAKHTHTHFRILTFIPRLNISGFLPPLLSSLAISGELVVEKKSDIHSVFLVMSVLRISVVICFWFDTFKHLYSSFFSFLVVQEFFYSIHHSFFLVMSVLLVSFLIHLYSHSSKSSFMFISTMFLVILQEPFFYSSFLSYFLESAHQIDKISYTRSSFISTSTL